MTTTADSLRAAKALINTVEKFEALGRSHSAALYQATSSWEEFVAADQVLDKIVLRGVGHANLMNRFDRAVAAAEAQS